MSKTSKTVYRRAWALYNEFLSCINNEESHAVVIPLTSQKVLEFISYLHLNRLASATITTYITAISFVHKMANQYDPTAVFCVQKILSAINKIHGKQDSRLPITLILLSRLTLCLPNSVRTKYHRTLLQAMFTTAFFGLCRIGEITKQPDGVVSLEFNQIQINSLFLTLSITHFKHNKAQRPILLKIFRQDDQSICPVFAMLNYMNVRPNVDGPLFCFPDGKAITRNFFTKNLKSCLTCCGMDTKQYSSHSFRIGGASYLASLGLSDTQIKTMGRWDSYAFLRYIRNQRYIYNN